VPGRPSGLYRIRPFKPIGAEPAPAAAAGGARVVVSPNPSRVSSGTRFVVARPPSGPSELRIVDAAGRLVRTLPGAAVIDWDGRGDDGAALAAGVYFYSLRERGRDSALASGRVVLIR
jgi:hypothetical protein